MSVVSVEEEIQAEAPSVLRRPDGSRMVRRSRPWLTALRMLVLIAAAIFFLLPVVWMVLTSFKLPGEYMHRPPIWIPENPVLNHYRMAFDDKGRIALTNSIVVATSATVLSLLVGTLAAYSISRLGTGGKHLSVWVLSQRMMPPVVVIVPLFLMLRDVGRINASFGLDTRFALIAIYTAFNLPFIVWMMRSYFDGVPIELEESAMVDGCTRLGVFWRIALPLALPGLIATGTFAFIFSWTEFLFAVVLTRTEAFTLPVAIAGYTGSQGSNYGQASALAVVATLPVFVLSLLVQRHFVRGLTLGAVRG
ncbi:MAG: carbohydrate ABC transporter permease [Thermomicrobiales bacterium]|nr:carbohydrate ABC transporter permease [Thermomicrobiales bacterium]